MCGIAGYFSLEQPAGLALVKAMCNEIRHRGPDDEGFHIDGGCAIGMRRLSIIDLATGHQPISNETGSVRVVLNGELYNYRELREELVLRGHRFSTQSDTEVLVHLYEAEGLEGLNRLRGMFAFALWDAAERRLVLARDRFGKKPLYYAVLPHGLYFASELKCLRVAGVPAELDEQALKFYFYLRYIPEPLTPWRAVKKLTPGGWLVYDQAGTVRTGRYWKLPAPAVAEPPGLSYEDACERVRELFDDSVKARLMSDVPLGAFLSGGLDSSSVVASMAKQSDRPVRTFSIGFEEASHNELPYAEAVARHYHTEHHSILLRPDAVSLIPRLARHFDEPFGDSSAIPSFLVSEFAVQQVKVALSGDGGDEAFAGYISFQKLEEFRRYDRIPQPARKLISVLADRLPYQAYGKNFLRMISRPTALERYFDWNTMPRFLLEQLLQKKWLLPADGAFLFRQWTDNLLPDGTDALSQAFYFEATANLTGDMLVKVDRMSMANSLEVRCPLLDHRLVEFAFSLPPHWKMQNGRGKRILVDALGGRLPAELLSLPKKGFSIPLPAWFRGPLREFLCDHLLTPRFRQRGFVSEKFLDYLVTEHVSGRRDNATTLYILLMLEVWMREEESIRATA
ncbi:MAG: asparagine synthase (glutamine-hydrolyzing) [Bryobacterales bacterium]|nr:asparagine synthase (glutamine-hydrolyzing) [Bryobacterales bacterium]